MTAAMAAAPASVPKPKPKAENRTQFERRMADHIVPPYAEVNFRIMTFIMARAPKLSDFPRERCANASGAAADEDPCCALLADSVIVPLT